MKTKKIVSVILSVLMLLSSLAVCAFAEESPKFYVALGDSIAAGTKLFNADVQAYGAIIAKTAGWDFDNEAIPGHTTENLLARLDEEEVKEAVGKADIISVSIGGNNFLMNGLVGMIADGVLKGDYSKMDAIMEDFYGSFDACIKKIKEINPDAELFVQTLYNPMPGVIGESYAEGQQRLNTAYKKYLEENPGAYTLIDIEPLFAGHEDYIATDYIHPNKAGHIVIANAYLQKMHEMGLCEADTAIEPTTQEIYSFDIAEKFADLWFQFTNALKLMFSGLMK